MRANDHVNLASFDQISFDRKTHVIIFRSSRDPDPDAFEILIPERYFPHVRHLPGKNSLIVLTDIEESSTCMIVTYDDDNQLTWYFIHDTGENTCEKWQHGWRPDPADGIPGSDVHRSKIIKHLYGI